MSESTPEQLRFPPVAGFSVRGDFDGGGMSSDFGPMILRGVDRQIGLIERLNAAIDDWRHPSYVTHGMREMIAQRVYQIACAYEDGNPECRRARDTFWDVQVPKMTALGDSLCAPVRPAPGSRHRHGARPAARCRASP